MHFPGLCDALRGKAQAACGGGLAPALQDGTLRSLAFAARPKTRIHQFEFSKNITDFAVSTGSFISAP